LLAALGAFNSAGAQPVGGDLTIAVETGEVRQKVEGAGASATRCLGVVASDPGEPLARGRVSIRVNGVELRDQGGAVRCAAASGEPSAGDTEVGKADWKGFLNDPFFNGQANSGTAKRGESDN
jgi:hypothetical protein